MKTSIGEIKLRNGKRMFYMNTTTGLTACAYFLDAPIIPRMPRFILIVNNIELFKCKSYSFFKKRLAKLIVDNELTFCPEFN